MAARIKGRGLRGLRRGQIIFLAVLLLLTAATGGITAAAARQGATVLFSQLLIGAMDLREVFAFRRAYLVCLVRLILLPGLVAVCFALAVHSGFHRGLEYILMVVLVATAAPPAVMLTQTSQTYGGDPRYASIINVMGTILCIVTIPLIIAFYEYLVAVL